MGHRLELFSYIHRCRTCQKLENKQSEAKKAFWRLRNNVYNKRTRGKNDSFQIIMLSILLHGTEYGILIVPTTLSWSLSDELAPYHSHSTL